MAETTTTTTETNTTGTTENIATTETKATEPNKALQQEPGNSALTTEALEKIIQSRVDKANADLGKKISALQKENEKLKKDSLSAEELKQLEMGEKEKELAERERTLLDRENRLFAIKAIKEIGLDDGSGMSLSLVDFVMAEDEKAITERVKSFNDLVQKFVSAKVDEKFKAIGRTPNGAAQNTEHKKETSVAESLGKRKAEQNKQTNDVLNFYLGGNK